MWHHINILSNMFTIKECTNYTELIYEIHDVPYHGLEFSWVQHVFENSKLTIYNICDR